MAGAVHREPVACPGRRVAALLLCLAAGLPAGGPARAGEAAITVGGDAVVRELAAGQAESFGVDLRAGGAYEVAAEQLGIDVVLAVRAPDGSLVASADGPLERWGTEAVLLRPAAAGRFLVEVRSAQRGVGPGRYRLRVTLLAADTAAARHRIAALAAVTAAGALLFPTAAAGAGGGDDRLARALDGFTAAREEWRAAGDLAGEAEAVNVAAALARRLGRRGQAAALYREAAARWRGLGGSGREIRAWNDLGLVLWETGDLPGAEDALAQGMAQAAGGGGREVYDLADLRNNQCLLLQAKGAAREALACSLDALARFESLGESRDEASVLNNIGFAHYNLGEPQPAEDCYRQALVLRQADGDLPGEAQSLNNLAVLYRALGDFDRALASYARVREIAAGLDDRYQEAATLNNLGVVYNAVGETERARLYFTQALAMRRAVEDRRGEASTLNNLGWLARGGGAAAAAIPFHEQALALARATGDARGEALTLSYLGDARTAGGAPAAALSDLDAALVLLRRIGDRFTTAVTLRHRGEALAALPAPASIAPALAGFGEALALSRELGDRAGEAATLTARGRALRDAGRLDEALADAAAAVALVERLRTRLAGTDLRAAFLGSVRDTYDLQIDVLMRLDAARPGAGFDGAALAASERARARALLDLVRESGAAAGVDPASEARRRDLERRLDLAANRLQNQLAGAGRGAASGAAADHAAAAALDVEVRRLGGDLEDLDAELSRRHPRYAALTAVEAASVPAIQALLDPDTLLLEFALGRDRSYLWVVGAATLHAFALPGREPIERAARAFHEALSVPPEDGTGRARLGESLSRLLLGAAAGELGDHRLAFVADGALHYIPFDALPEPTDLPAAGARSAAMAEPPALVRRHEIVELPSAAVLAAERRARPAGSGGGAPADGAAALAIVVADPVFDRDDSRLPANGASAASRASGAADGDAHLGRLRFAGQEAAAIAQLAPAGAVVADLGFAANRDRVLSGRLRTFRYVHFATHGVFDAARPELSGLVLSRFDAAGQPRGGMLRLRDVYGLDLDADLVVLSGCQTALGREIRGEGLLGLTRGFLVAGSARVMASLWWIDDRATALLMAAFYRALWSDGLRPAAALRQARLALAGERRFRDPYYWSAFVLQGDWR